VLYGEVQAELQSGVIPDLDVRVAALRRATRRARPGQR
jgi:hypothetical protein